MDLIGLIWLPIVGTMEAQEIEEQVKKETKMRNDDYYFKVDLKKQNMKRKEWEKEKLENDKREAEQEQKDDEDSDKPFEVSDYGVPVADGEEISERSIADQSRHWTTHPGKLQEHIDPSTSPKLRRRQLHSPETASPRTFTQKASFASDSTEESVFPKDNETQEYEYGDEDRNDDITAIPTSSKIFNSVKVGFAKTKEGISHGFGSAGHKLGLWDEETSTAFPSAGEEHGLASNGTPNSNASSASKHITSAPTPTPTPTPILAPPPLPTHEVNHTNDINQGHPYSPETEIEHDITQSHPLLNDKLNHIKDTAKSTAGLSTMGVILFLIIGLWVACLFRRSMRKRGRYTHLADDSEAWKLTTNGDGGVLAHEFDEFGMRNGSVGGSDDEEAQRKRSH